MAEAKVFFRFDGPGNNWQGPHGYGSSSQFDRNGPADHAERQAWREAQKELRSWYDQRKSNFPDQGLEVKIWVDQLVCPNCQLWMIAGVLRNLAAFEFKPKLFVEVETAGHTQMIQVTRNAVWPVSVSHANVRTLAALKEVGVQINPERQK